MAKGEPITLRLTIRDPVPGLAYSLQDGEAVVDPKVATEAPLSFDLTVRLSEGRLLGGFIRREGPVRRFVYIRLGRHGEAVAGRVKVDVHDIPADLLERARSGSVLEVVLPGRDAKGRPAYASVKPVEGWRVPPPNLNPR